jgi:hypothetical protein
MQKLDDQDDDQDPPSEGGGSAGANVGPYAKTNRQFRSTTDPDATLVRQGGLKSRLRYKTHRMVDDAHEIITAVVETTTGTVDETSQLLGLIEAHEDTTEQAVRTVIADARYGSVSNLIGCQKAKIRAHVKLLGDSIRGKGAQRGNLFGRAFQLRSSDQHLSLSGQSDHETQASAPPTLDLGVCYRQGYLPDLPTASLLYPLTHRSHHPPTSRSRAARKSAQDC